MLNIWSSMLFISDLIEFVSITKSRCRVTKESRSAISSGQPHQRSVCQIALWRHQILEPIHRRQESIVGKHLITCYLCRHLGLERKGARRTTPPGFRLKFRKIRDNRPNPSIGLLLGLWTVLQTCRYDTISPTSWMPIAWKYIKYIQVNLKLWEKYKKPYFRFCRLCSENLLKFDLF